MCSNRLYKTITVRAAQQQAQAAEPHVPSPKSPKNMCALRLRHYSASRLANLVLGTSITVSRASNVVVNRGVQMYIHFVVRRVWIYLYIGNIRPLREHTFSILLLRFNYVFFIYTYLLNIARI